MDIMVRQAVETDAKGIAVILRELEWFDLLNAEDLKHTVSRTQKWLRVCHSDDSHSVYIAEGEDGRVMGYASMHWLPYLYLDGPEGYLSELFIREDDRGHGIGTLLLEYIKAEAQRRGCSRLMLINMRKQESYHREFYIKQNWEEREQAVNFLLDLTK